MCGDCESPSGRRSRYWLSTWWGTVDEVEINVVAKVYASIGTVVDVYVGTGVVVEF